jgi:Mg-chelatase subunit ChlD
MSDDKLTSTKLPDIMKPLRQNSIRASRVAAREALKDVNPLTCENRLGLEFDDSGSMSGQPLQDAKDAVRNFLHSCKQLDTSVAVYPMNQESKPLTIDYDLINLYVGGLEIRGNTPLYTCLSKMLDDPITRGVIFSDGSTTDSRNPYSSQLQLTGNTIKEDTIAKAKQKEIPLDCIFIGFANSPGYNEMKWIAEQTGGVFIHFQDSKSLTSGLKYLSPGLRGMLMNPAIKAKIERGETI